MAGRSVQGLRYLVNYHSGPPPLSLSHSLSLSLCHPPRVTLKLPTFSSCPEETRRVHHTPGLVHRVARAEEEHGRRVSTFYFTLFSVELVSANEPRTSCPLLPLLLPTVHSQGLVGNISSATKSIGDRKRKLIKPRAIPTLHSSIFFLFSPPRVFLWFVNFSKSRAERCRVSEIRNAWFQVWPS